MDAESVLGSWLHRSGEFSPAYYAYYGADDRSDAIRETVRSLEDPRPSILELGCSSGRHLAHLHDDGYRDLWGIDVNEEAFSVMAETYPDLAASVTVVVDSIEAALEAFDDGQFDVVYSVETLQHIRPAHAWVFAEIARVTADRLVTVEIESGDVESGSEESVTYVDDGVPLYYRDWDRTFTDLGFELRETRQLDRDTLRVFEPAGD